MKAKDLVAFFQTFDPEHDVLFDTGHHRWGEESNAAWPLVPRVISQNGLTEHLTLVRDPDPTVRSGISHVCGVGPLPSVGEVRQRVLLEKAEGETHPSFKGRLADEWLRVDWFLSPGDPVRYTRMRREGDGFVEDGPPGDGFLPYFSVRDGYRPVTGARTA